MVSWRREKMYDTPCNKLLTFVRDSHESCQYWSAADEACTVSPGAAAARHNISEARQSVTIQEHDSHVQAASCTTARIK